MLGLYDRKVLLIHHALLIWEEMERILRFWASIEFTCEVVSTSPWVAGLFKGAMVRLAIHGRGLHRSCMVTT